MHTLKCINGNIMKIQIRLLILTVAGVLVSFSLSHGQHQIGPEVFGTASTNMQGTGAKLSGTVGQTFTGLGVHEAILLAEGFWNTGYQSFVTSSVHQPEKDLPRVTELHQNYPNPFNPVTVISFSLPETTEVNLSVYDSLGRLVQRVLTGESMTAGTHEINFDASRLSSGVYIYRLELSDIVLTRKMMIVK